MLASKNARWNADAPIGISKPKTSHEGAWISFGVTAVPCRVWKYTANPREWKSGGVTAANAPSLRRELAVAVPANFKTPRGAIPPFPRCAVSNSRTIDPLEPSPTIVLLKSR